MMNKHSRAEKWLGFKTKSSFHILLNIEHSYDKTTLEAFSILFFEPQVGSAQQQK